MAKTKKKKKFYPCSWSESARWLADTIFDQVQDGDRTIEDAIIFFNHSYRAEIIRHRAAKRFGRLVRKNLKF